MSGIDDLLENNQNYAESHAGDELAGAPRLKVAVVACMDARLNVFAALGLSDGDAHVIRNAGGVVTDDAIRSLAVSQRVLGSEEVMLIHHTGCGMLTLDDEQFLGALEQDAGERPAWSPGSFSDLDEDVRRSIARVKESPFLPHTSVVRGFVYELETGRLREVV